MLRDDCQQFFYLHEGRRPAETLRELAEYCDRHQVTADCYGDGKVISEFDRQIAQLLDKPAAIFMPSGTMAQQIAMRIWSEKKAINKFGCHPSCHMEFNEYHAYKHLHGLDAELIGNQHDLFTLEDLQSIDSAIAALLIELPQRWIGGQLPTWGDLIKICDYATEHNIALHLDGARLWECTDYYQRSLAEICALFDSVYVSFYKTLGGISGAMLLGEQAFIDDSRVWLRRHGGNLYQLYPYVISAKLNLEKHLPHIPEYCRRAREIADLLNKFDVINTTPTIPVTNMLHVYFQYDVLTLTDARNKIAEEHGTWLCSRFHEVDQQGCYMELFVGENLLAMPDILVKQIVVDFIRYCQTA